jgi:very-short-patch-repair endonuclease/endogenous inhibitor of DNA gyrase (YacG/DUF329 family)
MITKTCQTCGKQFNVEFSRQKTAKFCSYKCYHLSLLGKKPWNKGKSGIYKAAVRRKMGAKNKGKKPWNLGKTKETDTRVKKYAHSLTGKKLPIGVRRKISKAHKGKAPWNKGKHWVTEEIKKKITEGARVAAKELFKSNPELRMIISEASKKNWQNPEYRQKVAKGISVALKNYYKNPDARLKLSLQSKKWAEEHPEEILQVIKQARLKIKRCNTLLERKTACLLSTLGIEFIQQYRVGRKFADFALLRKKVIIECDGKFWHKNKQAELDRNEYMLSRLGKDWRIIHLDEDSVDTLFQSKLI